MTSTLCLTVTFFCALFILTSAWLGKHNQPMQDGIKSYVMSQYR